MNECPQDQSGVVSFLAEVLSSVFWVIAVVAFLPMLLALFAIIELITTIYNTVLVALPFLGWGMFWLIMLGGLYLIFATIFYYLRERISTHSKT